MGRMEIPLTNCRTCLLAYHRLPMLVQTLESLGTHSECFSNLAHTQAHASRSIEYPVGRKHGGSPEAQYITTRC